MKFLFVCQRKESKKSNEIDESRCTHDHAVSMYFSLFNSNSYLKFVFSSSFSLSSSCSSSLTLIVRIETRTNSSGFVCIKVANREILTLKSIVTEDKNLFASVSRKQLWCRHAAQLLLKEEKRKKRKFQIYWLCKVFFFSFSLSLSTNVIQNRSLFCNYLNFLSSFFSSHFSFST